MTSRSAALRAAHLEVPFCPHEPTQRQRLFLSLNHREALYGGQVGGGKSDALLMAALEYAEVPGYSAILFRRTFADLSLPGALMDRAREWLSPTSARWVDREHRWVFPSGASLAFGYLDTDVDRFRYQGAEFHYVGFDELTQFTEIQYTYLLSRLRRLVESRVPVRARGATNPGGVGHAWVKARFVDPGDKARPFIRSGLDDNPHLDAEDYRRSLALLDSVTRDQLERGLWVTDDSQRVYRYDSRNDCDALPAIHTDPDGRLWKRILVIDLGSSTKDRTTGVVRLAWHPHLRDSTIVEYAKALSGMIPSTIAEYVKRELDECGEELRVVFDEGALGKGYGGEMRVRYGIPVVPAEKSEKRANRRLLNGALERAEVKLIRGKCDDLSRELETLIYDARGLDCAPGLADHCSDALLYGWRESHSFRAQAPAEPVVYQSPEWWEQRERAALAKEYERARSDGRTGFERW